MNVQMREHVLRTFVTPLLVHMHQKEKIALEIAAKIASINGLVMQCRVQMFVGGIGRRSFFS